MITRIAFVNRDRQLLTEMIELCIDEKWSTLKNIVYPFKSIFQNLCSHLTYRCNIISYTFIVFASLYQCHMVLMLNQVLRLHRM